MTLPETAKNGPLPIRQPSPEQPPFEEPWQAQALATAMSLQDAGVFTAGEWSDALGAAIKDAQAAGDPDTGHTYYNHVLDALENLLRDKKIVAAAELAERKSQWVNAYETTPHGQAVNLPGASQ